MEVESEPESRALTPTVGFLPFHSALCARGHSGGKQDMFDLSVVTLTFQWTQKG